MYVVVKMYKMLCENKCINVVWKKIKKLGRKKNKSS